MYTKLLISIALIVFVSGCATTSRKTNDNEIQQLKTQAYSLETKLQAKEREIDRLENELEKVREKRPVVSGKSEVRKLSVKELQKALKNTGYYKGSIDGKPGSATTEAVRAFQGDHNLKIDGIVGNKTNAKLSQYLNEQ